MAYRVSRRLFVSNLPWTVSHRELFEYFAQFGPVVNHNVIFDKTTGLSRKFGFVQFGNEDGLRQVFKQKTHTLEGNTISIQESNDENDRRRNRETEL